MWTHRKSPRLGLAGRVSGLPSPLDDPNEAFHILEDEMAQRTISRNTKGSTIMRMLPLGAAMLFFVASMSACEDTASDPAGPLPATPSATASHSPSVPPGIDVADGFSVEVLSPRSEFPDQVDATFKIKLDGRATRVAHLRDLTEILLLEVTFEEGGSNGWHTHPAVGFFAVRSGVLGLINASDCVVRFYKAGQAFVDPGQGNVHVAFNALSTGEETVIVGGFIGLPPNAAVSTSAPTPDC